MASSPLSVAMKAVIDGPPADSTASIEGIATAINTYAEDFPQSYTQATKSSAQSIPHGADTEVVYNVEAKDLLGEFNTTSGRFTANAAGVYVASWRLELVSTAWGTSKVFAAFLSRNNTTSGTAGYRWDGQVFYHSDVAVTRCVTSGGFATVWLDATDTLSIYVYQDSGGAINTYSGSPHYNRLNTFTVARVS